MTRKERLMNSITGKPVDRPAVCFYELTGFDENPDDPNPFNIYNHHSWRPLIALAAEHSDRIVRRPMCFRDDFGEVPADLRTHEEYREENSISFIDTIKAGERTLSCRTRRDAEVNTVWTTAHLLHDEHDLDAYLALPLPPAPTEPDIRAFIDAEEKLGDTGIVMADIPDPLCLAAQCFSMEDYTIIALTDQMRFRRLLDRFAAYLYPRVELFSRALPGRLWRICGPEYATPPYLPPALFHDYVKNYDTQIVRSIQSHGGYARIHSHGKIRDVLPYIAETGCVGLDPIEPPNQGDVGLSWVRERYGSQFTLFGNIEASEISLLPSDEFRIRVKEALREGTMGYGRGFVLMPSAIPYSRELPAHALENFRLMITESQLI